MSNPMPIGLGPDEDERVAAFQYGRFTEEEGMTRYSKLDARTRKMHRREVREIVDALRGCGYRVEQIERGIDGCRCSQSKFGVGHSLVEETS